MFSQKRGIVLRKSSQRIGNSNNKKKKICGGISCVAFLGIVLFLQTSAIVLFAVHVSNASVAGGGDASQIINPEQAKEWDAVDRSDPRAHRILYDTARTTNDNNGKDGSPLLHDNNSNASSTLSERPSLDNYGSRPHFAKPPESVLNGPDATTLPYLVIGGSDGSGTRAVVNTLIELGAFIHVEDRTTMDIHGSEMFHRGGWPPLVNLIMNYTRSGNYEASDLPPDVREMAVQQLKRLKAGIDKRAKGPKGHMKRMIFDKMAVGIHIGWKAPVSMLLLPLLREAFGPIKFLHVVRDGRDVSFSDNKSPVKKFYNTYYGKPEENELYLSKYYMQRRDKVRTPFEAARMHQEGHEGRIPVSPLPPPKTGAPVPDDDKTLTIRAMELWNDWNYQVNQYGNSHADGSTFDYLVIRSEDLVNPDTKLDALLQLADFVGSQHSLRDLCCHSKREVKDMGKSNGGLGQPGHNSHLGGHWRGKPKNLAELRARNQGYLEHKRPFDGRNNRGGSKSSRYDSKNAEDDDRAAEEKGSLHPKRAITGPVIHVHGKYGEQNQHHEAQHDVTTGKRDLHNLSYPPLVAVSKMSRRLLGLPFMADNGSQNQHQHNTHHAQDYGFHAVSRRLSPAGGRRPDLSKPGKVREAPEQVMARYGKWVQRLENEPELSQELHELGRTALQAFGYEPPMPFLDPPDESFGQQCEDLMKDFICPEPKLNQAYNFRMPGKYL